MCLCFSWTCIIHLFSIFIYFFVFARSLWHFIDLHNRLTPAEASLKIAGECQPAASSRRFWPCLEKGFSPCLRMMAALGRSFVPSGFSLPADFGSKCTKKLKKTASMVLHPTLQQSQHIHAHQSGLTCSTRLRWGDTNAELHIFEQCALESLPHSSFCVIDPEEWISASLTVKHTGLLLLWPGQPSLASWSLWAHIDWTLEASVC